MTIERLGYSLGMLAAPEEMLWAGKEADRSKNTHSLWVPESWGREVFSSLGALSQVTKRAKIGVLAPSPNSILLLEKTSRVAADIAIVEGGLEYILAIELPSLALLVT